MKKKLKLAWIANARTRKASFKKRKRGIMKKLDELTTLCGVKACGVICSPHLSEPELWPSKEGFEEVASEFKEMPETQRTKYMMNHETYLQERIAKVQHRRDELASDNQELQVRQFMFDCLERKMWEYRFGPKELHDLRRYIDHYNDKITRRIQILAENGESSSSSSSFPPIPYGVADAGTASAARWVYDHIPDHNMNMNLPDQQETTQHHVPMTPYDITDQFQHMNMNQNQEPVQYQLWNPNHNNLNANIDLNPNQYMSQPQSFMGMLMGQHAGGHADIPFMDGNQYNYNQQPIVDLAVTSSTHHVSTSTTDACAPPYINNNL